MDNDRELLELAAKAANLPDAEWDNFYGSISYTAQNGIKDCPWYPFSSDADAHRLMVNLCMLINVGETEVMVAGGPDIMISLTYGVNDKEETVRRAIVLAAAEIGRRM